MSEDSIEMPLKPRPRKAFDLNTPVSVPGTPAPEQNGFSTGSARPSMEESTTPARTRSILNLTSSTLFGIYQDTDVSADKEVPSTPWGTGSRTPVDGRRSSLDLLRASIPEAFARPNGNSKPKRQTPQTRRRAKRHWTSVVGSTIALFAVGVFYGIVVSHLHDRAEINPVRVDGIRHGTPGYLAFWGLAGILLGHALPAVDTFWTTSNDGRPAKQPENASRGSGGWNDVVRSVGAFVGVAFAIRKLPWQSTLQLSLTLALANPAVWYLIDRSMPGFVVSAIVAIAGTGVVLGVNPGLVPAPAPPVPASLTSRLFKSAAAIPKVDHLVLGVFSEESVGVTTWIASVLFVSAVCFGNIGRKLVAESR